jgi:hypothetical protein
MLLLGTVACAAPRANNAAKIANRPAESAVMAGSDAAPDTSNQAPSGLAKPQLIKTATLRLTVTDIDPAIAQLRQILKQQQGDIYNFDDYRGESGERRRVDLALKVPQQNLDKTLEALSQLGNVINTNVSSQDVTDQIVDTDARLKNLRRQEAMTQQLMDRSGSLKDVLAVSQQLSQVRDQIERLDAQVTRLKNQVAYSTINLQMEAAIVGAPVTNTPFGLQVQDRWNRSTRTASQLMINLLLFGVGLIPFLPFLLLLGGGAYVTQRRIRHHKRKSQQLPPANSSHTPS